MTYFALVDYASAVLKPALIDVISLGEGGRHWFALVDTAFDYEKNSLRLPGCVGLALYSQGRLEGLANVSPKLFKLATTDNHQLQTQLGRLLNHCRGRPMLSFVRSNLQADELSSCWQNLLEVETDDSERYVLRFADTRVLAAVPEQKTIWSHLAANIEEWWTISREGKLIELPVSEAPEPDAAAIRVDHRGLSALLELGQADAMADYLHEHFPELLSVRDGFSNYKLLDQVSVICTAHGIDGITEQYALAVATLLTDGRVLEDPAFEDWLRGKNWQAIGMEEALADWMDEKGVS